MSTPLLRAAQVFAGYTIVRLLGSGGMGEVYLAQHPRLPRREALKILGGDVSADEDYRRRFVREADLAAALWHPNIVRVNDRGECDGRLWIAMDFVDGTDAASLLRDRYPVGMPADQVATIVTAIAGALDYAHEHHDLLHRDVNPANILLAKPGDGEQRILLGDFGIARHIADSSGLTATNMTIGTFPYAAPEQLTGEPTDGRADQYALAATAYHLLTGTTLFPYTNPVAVISHHLTAPPPALAKTRAKLAAFDPVLAVALAKDPADRFPRCTDFARAFAEAAPWRTPTDTAATMQIPLAVRPPASVALPPINVGKQQRRRRRRIFAAAAAILAFDLVGATGYAVEGGSGTAGHNQAVASPAPARPPAPAPPRPAPGAPPPASALPTPAPPVQVPPAPRRASAPPVASRAHVPVAAAPTHTPPVPRRQAPGPDQVYLDLASQIPGVTVSDPKEATATARGVCAGLQKGVSPDDAAAATQHRSGLTPAQAAAGVNAAITAYCPQYRR
ncbi:serine/threonine-protein kinase [Mycobacterium servetii]|uniref:non-specific serine/threonine protein kinase n=1 Tax=Mycobacterium servetii TaxID=3237418 RepID=A0ABV4C2Q4_9MYCO